MGLVSLELRPRNAVVSGKGNVTYSFLGMSSRMIGLKEWRDVASRDEWLRAVMGETFLTCINGGIR